jgi:hypothetical protein
MKPVSRVTSVTPMAGAPAPMELQMRPRYLERVASLGALTLAVAVSLAAVPLAGQAATVTMLNASAPRTSPRPSTFANLNFIVSAARSKAMIKGATVTIDYNSGNGTDRTTDGSGFCNFGVISPRTYRYTVTKPDYDRVVGEVSVTGSGAFTVPVVLELEQGRRP